MPGDWNKFKKGTMTNKLPKEAIECEDEWQLVQDHLEDKIWDEAFYALKRLKNLQLNLHNLLLSKMTEHDTTCNDCLLVSDCTKN